MNPQRIITAVGSPKITVLMAVHDEPLAYLQEACDSICAQTERSFEVCVVADGPLRPELKKFLATLVAKDKRFTVLIEKERRGLAAAMNRAIGHARAPYCARMDADDRCFPERFKKQRAYMEQHPAVGFLFSGAIIIDETGKQRGMLMPKRERLMHLKRNLFMEPVLIHPTLFARTALLRKHRYDERAQRSQDFDLWLRTIDTVRFDCIEEPLLAYRIPSIAITERLEKVKKWNGFARDIVRRHLRAYKSNPWYWLFVARLHATAAVYALPKPLLKAIMRMKSAARGKS